MVPPETARFRIDIKALTRPIAVDHRISLPYYFRIADCLTHQAKIYRDEKKILDLYVILLRYSSLRCETIPKHRDYIALVGGSGVLQKLIADVFNELESLKPAVERQLAEHNEGGTVESDDLNGNYAANHTTEQYAPTADPPQEATTVHCKDSSLVGIIKWPH